MKNINIILIITLVLTSCNKDESSEFKVFNKFNTVSNLECKIIKTPSVLYYIGEMIMLDSVLITLDMKADTILRIFKLPTCRYLGGAIRKGRGPNEEIMIFPDIKKIENNRFIYRSINAIKIASYNKDYGKIKIAKVHFLPGELMDLFQITMLGNKFIGYNALKSNEQDFILYNPDTKSNKGFGPLFPNVNKKIPVSKRSMLFTKLIEKKPDNSLIVSAYDKFPIIRIYNNNGELNTEIRFNNQQDFPYSMVKTNPTQTEMLNMTMNYTKLKVTNKYIYALYIGKTLKEMNANERHTDDYSNEIHVFDWNGKPVRKILLDQYIFSFCITPNDDYLIASSLNSINKLYQYKL